MRVKKGFYRYGIMDANNAFHNLHTNSIKQLIEYAVVNFMQKRVVVWSAETEINLLIEKDGLFWPNYERASAKEISKIFNKRDLDC